ncbi:MAG: hypothetical protein H7Z37_09905 [Pyrinomonadaceae bacterium]|nr:hypothetical protein [Pyrinomonadaceae bacterium]
MRKLILSIAFAMFSSVAVHAQNFDSMPSFKPEIKRIAIFKNGYAYTYREGEAQTANGWAYTTNVPVGVFGTVFGYTTNPNLRVTKLLASETERRDVERIENLTDFLLANENSRARFTLNYSTRIVENGTSISTNKIVEGSYQVIGFNGNFLASEKIVDNPNSYLRLDQNQTSVIVKSETGTLYLPVSQIQSVEILGTTRTEKPTLTKENRLAIKLNNDNAGNVNIGIAALERGVNWIPAYRLELKGEPAKEAKLELEANFVNNLSDFNDAEMFFVVGAPSFLFQNQLSPLSVKAGFENISNEINVRAARPMSRDKDSGVNFATGSSVGRLNSTLDVATEVAPTIDEEERGEGSKAEQLFLYKTSNVTMKKGDRASLRLFSLTVPCSEVFEWTIDDAPQTDNYIASGQLESLPAFASRFWYGLKLKNTTGMPLTTAPALVFKDANPLGQGLLTFTPVANEKVVRVSPATEIIGTHKLAETARATEQRKINGAATTFNVITIEGTIKITNVKTEPVEVVITRNFSGKVTSASDGGKTTREGLNPNAFNPISTVTWNLTAPSGDKEIRYVYKVYVRV